MIKPNLMEIIEKKKIERFDRKKKTDSKFVVILNYHNYLFAELENKEKGRNINS
jgi:hypothetical protein